MVWHGDFHPNNFFADGNNIWVFDFDECCYGDFLQDMAAVLLTWLMYGYKPEKSRRDASDLLKAGCKTLTLDCATLTYISAAGIRVLIQAYKGAQKLVLANLTEAVREVLEMTGLLEQMCESK